jgi:hypothetical protein
MDVTNRFQASSTVIPRRVLTVSANDLPLMRSSTRPRRPPGLLPAMKAVNKPASR